MPRRLSAEQKAAVKRITDLCNFWQIDRQTLEQHLPRGLTAEQQAAVKKIQTLCDYFGIDIEMLRGVPAPVPSAQIKYRHPTTGDTWTGEGPQPDWLRTALTKEGFTVEELRLPQQGS